MKCPSCSTEVSADSAFCHKCGAKIQGSSNSGSAGNGATATEKFRAAVQSRNDITNEKETELWQGSFSAKAMYGSWLAAGLLSIALIIAGVLFPPALIPVAGILIIVWIGLAFYYFYRRVSVHYALTTQRFVHQWGILVRTTDRIEVIEMDDVTFVQGLVERMIGVGTIKITSSDKTHPEIWLHGIDNVQKVASLIDDARWNERRRRGIHIEQV